MSHFSRIKTSITDLEVLQQTLKDLEFEYSIDKPQLKDANGNLEYVDLFAKKNTKNIIGFLWNGKEYTFISDFELWQNHYKLNPNILIERILQQYSINSIIKTTSKEGFNTVKKLQLKDGSIKLVAQRWN
uniref:Uncharacterized protein ycf35 n=1 Tax=Hydropuntia rangiferina TaxID=338881 RepID=A0A345U845_9FLOR|nr:hypothetical protein [Hydropuntia rangiferina]AXI96631.1 hypothetical protein [Hydropuntia rangiferina]UAD87314.1 hypothetical protein [Hydropuntia rangiferina]